MYKLPQKILLSRLDYLSDVLYKAVRGGLRSGSHGSQATVAKSVTPQGKWGPSAGSELILSREGVAANFTSITIKSSWNWELSAATECHLLLARYRSALTINRE